MFEGAAERDKEKWKHTLYLMQNVRDTVAAALGGKPKGADYLWIRMSAGGGRKRHRWESMEEYREWLKEADRKVKEKHRKRKQKS